MLKSSEERASTTAKLPTQSASRVIPGPRGLKPPPRNDIQGLGGGCCAAKKSFVYRKVDVLVDQNPIGLCEAQSTLRVQVNETLTTLSPPPPKRVVGVPSTKVPQGLAKERKDRSIGAMLTGTLNFRPTDAPRTTSSRGPGSLPGAGRKFFSHNIPDIWSIIVSICRRQQQPIIGLTVVLRHAFA